MYVCVYTGRRSWFCRPLSGQALMVGAEYGCNRRVPPTPLLSWLNLTPPRPQGGFRLGGPRSSGCQRGTASRPSGPTPWHLTQNIRTRPVGTWQLPSGTRLTWCGLSTLTGGPGVYIAFFGTGFTAVQSAILCTVPIWYDNIVVPGYTAVF